MKGDLQVDDRMDENPKKLNISLVNVGMTIGHVSLIYIL